MVTTFDGTTDMPKEPINIRGTAYSSRKEAAATFGIAPETVRRHEARGTTDMIGLKRYSARPVVRYFRDECRIWPSIKAAAKEIGTSEWFIKTYCTDQLRGWRFANDAEIYALKRYGAATVERKALSAHIENKTRGVTQRPNVGEQRDV